MLVDVGRLRPSSPAWRLAGACDVRVVVVRPVLEELEPLLGRLDALAALGPLVIAVRGAGPYGPADVADAVGGRAEVCPVAEDGRGVAVMYGHRSGRLDRTMVVRSARSLAAIVTRTSEVVVG